jgi:hypothetical protein
MTGIELLAFAALLAIGWRNNTVLAVTILAIQYALAGYGAWRWFTKS